MRWRRWSLAAVWAVLAVWLAIAVVVEGGPRLASADAPAGRDEGRLVRRGLESVTSGPARQHQDDEPDVELFSRADCPQCARARAYLTELQAERPALVVRTVDVVQDADALGRLEQLAQQAGARSIAVPTFHVRGQLVVGWAGREVTGRRIEALLDGSQAASDAAIGEGCSVESAVFACEAPPVRDVVEVPLLGAVDARSLGLPLFTAVVGLLDGFNPCAMWTLLLLLSLLVRLRSRLRMLLLAGTFVLVSGLVYFAFMAAWLNVFLLVGLTREIQIGLGVVAVLVGLVSLKDAVAFRRGFSLSIPDPVKPRIYARVGRILQAPRLASMLVGVAILALLVNGVELLCTAGLPAVYTQVLTSHGLPSGQYYAYLALYQIFYMLDDTAMLLIVVSTLSLKRLQEREGRYLKLLSGAVLVGLGAALLFRPELLHW